MDLRGTNVIVTGASRGLGRALAPAAAAGLHGHELGDACLIAPRIFSDAA